VDGVSLDLRDQMVTLMTKARTRAVADAKARAEQYAQAAGMRLGPVLSISETGSSSAPGPVFPGAAFMAESAVPISAGQQQVTSSVVVVYQLAS
ncbi:MAG TPA: SIMPL domain-containing protein, partial [Streptosporangiaceae bacterium]